MKRQVAKAYNIQWEDRSRYEFDHLIPRSLGGADSVRNLWPQLWSSARRKDVLEVRLGKLVCSGKLSLRTARSAIRSDWVKAYRTYVTPQPALR